MRARRRHGLPTATPTEAAGADVAIARSQLVAHPAVLAELERIAALAGTAAYWPACARFAKRSGGLFAVGDVHRLARRLDAIREQIALLDEPLLGVGLADPFDRQPGRRARALAPGTIETAVASLALQIAGVPANTADRRAADHLNADRPVADWVEPAAIKVARRRLRQRAEGLT